MESHGKYSESEKTNSIAGSREKLLPDPAKDSVKCICYCLWHHGAESTESDTIRLEMYSGVLLMSPNSRERHDLANTVDAPVHLFKEEIVMIETFASMIKRWDPDFLVGYELHNSSFGYLIERYRTLCQQDLCILLSRQINPPRHDKPAREQRPNAWGLKKSSAIDISGRVVLNLWRLMNSELPLTSFSLENIAFHVLHVRVPKFTNRILCDWFNSGHQQWRALKYYMDRTRMNVFILDEINFIGRTGYDSLKN